MAADLKPPKRIFAHGWWTNEGEKISKSLGNIIDPYEIINDYGLDQIRYFLFREVPFGNDGDFSKKAISRRVNADLANNFGNLIQRVFSFINKNCNSKIQNKFDLNDQDKTLFQLANNKFIKYKNFFEKYEIDKAIKEVFEIISKTNVYIDNQAPWNLKKTNIIRMNVILSVSTEIIRRVTIMLSPIIPDSSIKIMEILNLDTKKINFDNIDQLPISPLEINSSRPIFPRIEK
jgi:methionyl-tRNA synthetase